MVDAVRDVDGQLLITADHGNAEQMRDPATGQRTPHQPAGAIDLRRQTGAGGRRRQADIAPTLLTLMGMEIPQEMTGKPLFIVE